MAKSNRVTLHESRRAFHLLAEVRDLRADLPDARQHLLEGLCRLTGARQGSTVDMANWGPTLDLKLTAVHHGGWASPEAARLWEESILRNQPRLDPLLDASTKLPGVLHTRLRNQILSDEALARLPDYVHLCKFAGVSDNLCCWFLRKGLGAPSMSGLTLHRAWGDRRFSDHDRSVLNLVNVELYRLHCAGQFNAPSPSEPGHDLPPYLKEVLHALLRGDSTKEAAARMGVKFRTAEGYVKELYKRYGVHSRGELFAKVVGAGGVQSN